MFSRDTGNPVLLWLEDAGIERDQHLVGLTTGALNLNCCKILTYFDFTFGPLIRSSLVQVGIRISKPYKCSSGRFFPSLLKDKGHKGHFSCDHKPGPDLVSTAKYLE